MTPTRLLVGQIAVVFAVVALGVWAATQWVAANAERFGNAELTDTFARMRAAIAGTVAQAEPHAAFLARVAGEGEAARRATLS